MIVSLLPLFAAEAAAADDRQFRQLKLADGRDLTVEIVSTEAAGLLVEVPQGRTLVSFELLVDMVPIDQAAFENQPPWVVYVDLPPEHQPLATELLKALPNTSVHPLTEPVGGVTAAMASEAQACGRRIECVVAALADSPWKWAITGSASPEGGLVLSSNITTSTDRATSRTVAAPSRDALWKALHDALGLLPPESGPPKATTDEPEEKRPATGFDEKKVVALSFVPVPGVPSLAQKDGAGVALAVGVVVPSTAIWVGAVGQTGRSVPEFAALSVAGYYTLTVLANQVAGFRSLDKGSKLAVSAAPNLGGATVTLGGTL